MTTLEFMACLAFALAYVIAIVTILMIIQKNFKNK